MTAKALHRTVLAVALAALGGSAAAQPTTNPNPSPTPTPAPTPTSTPCDPAVRTDCTDTTVSGGVSAGAGVDVNGTGVSGQVNGQVNGTLDASGNPIPPPATTTTVITPPPPATNVYVAPAPTYTPVVVEDHRSVYDRYGIAVSLGGGVEGFTGDTLRNSTDPGGGWNVRLGVGLKSPLSLEAAYIGSAQNIDALGLSGNALLVGNGAQADARLNLTGGMAVQPFVFGGAAWKRYQIMNETANTSDLVDKDDVIEFPLGVGIGARAAGLDLDLRGEYRIATEADLVSRTNPDARMDRFGVNASIGMAF